MIFQRRQLKDTAIDKFLVFYLVSNNTKLCFKGEFQQKINK